MTRSEHGIARHLPPTFRHRSMPSSMLCPLRDFFLEVSEATRHLAATLLSMAQTLLPTPPSKRSLSTRHRELPPMSLVRRVRRLFSQQATTDQKLRSPLLPQPLH
jgi:hypothetical protein